MKIDPSQLDIQSKKETPFIVFQGDEDFLMPKKYA
jgi:hypothetical protein